MQLNETFPTRKLIFIIVFFLLAWEVRAGENKIKPELMGLAVRSSEGVFLLSEKDIPMANTPVNFFALFLKEVTGVVELDLAGPINFTREELTEPYGLFESAEFMTLPEGEYAPTIKMANDGQVQRQYDFDFRLSTPSISHTGQGLAAQIASTTKTYLPGRQALQ